MERTPSQRKHIGVTQTECDKKKKTERKTSSFESAFGVNLL